MARAGEHQGGVTVHWVDVGEDTGDIILQGAFPLRDGMTAEEFLARVTEIGTRLIYDAVEAIAESGRGVPSQSQGEGHRNRRPRPKDAEIDPAWGARRIYNFVRLARKWHQPYLVHGGARCGVDEACWLPERRSQEVAVAVGRRRATVACPDGTVVLWRRGALAKAWDVVRILAGSGT
jgi:methionyl-tRNA formyltransferase